MTGDIKRALVFSISGTCLCDLQVPAEQVPVAAQRLCVLLSALLLQQRKLVKSEPGPEVLTHLFQDHVTLALFGQRVSLIFNDLLCVAMFSRSETPEEAALLTCRYLFSQFYSEFTKGILTSFQEQEAQGLGKNTESGLLLQF